MEEINTKKDTENRYIEITLNGIRYVRAFVINVVHKL